MLRHDGRLQLLVVPAIDSHQHGAVLIAGNASRVTSVAVHFLRDLITESFYSEPCLKLSTEREGAFFTGANGEGPIIETRSGLAIACADMLCDNVADGPRRDTVVKLVLIQLDRDSRKVLCMAGPVQANSGGSFHHYSAKYVSRVSRGSACGKRPRANQAKCFDNKVTIRYVADCAPEKPVEWAAGQLCQDGLGSVSSRRNGYDGPEEQGVLLKVEIRRLIWIEEWQEAVIMCEKFLKQAVDVALGQADSLELIRIMRCNAIRAAPFERQERINSLIRAHQGGIASMCISAVGDGRLELRMLEIVGVIVHRVALYSGLGNVAPESIDLLFHFGVFTTLANALKVRLDLALELEAIAPRTTREGLLYDIASQL